MTKKNQMTEEQFLAKIAECDVFFYKLGKNEFYPKGREVYSCISGKPTMDNHLYSEWTVGGIGGGSCWDDGTGRDPHYSIQGEVEPEFTAIDAVLFEVCPNLSFLQYRKLMADVMKTDMYTIGEYYGNSTSYACKSISLRDLFNKLIEMKVI